MNETTIAVVGLGYVGLPLAVALAKHFPTTGFDISQARVDALKAGHDRTGEIDAARLRESVKMAPDGVGLALTAAPADIAGHAVYIVTVPTPVDARNEPDLGAVRAACATVGKVIGKGAIVVFESTVYPGVTEDICGPALEAASGLACGRDFFLGYSPERINPGDRQHTIERITKVVAGQTPAVTETLARIYGAVTSGGVFPAASIRVAEAAKVIENAQRDINIAFVNEVTMIFERLGISVYDVLDAARTKWNFLPFAPGLVGGHCIGVDPFYLARAAMDAGHHPEIILAGRRINDGMGPWLAERIAAAMGRMDPARILVLGLTFKENVPDLRNSKVVDLVARLRELGHRVDVHDACADAAEARHEYGLELLASLDGAAGYDCVVGAVPHEAYARLDAAALAKLLKPGGLVADIKGMWRGLPASAAFRLWRP
jgi:UDP-N-acetyl-D-galactosamine dehydrogenase